MDKRVVLIGGQPLAGKSYLARKLSRKLNLPWISTDTIREQMRQLVRKEDYPKLFFFSDPKIKVVDYLTKNSPEKIVEDQNNESAEDWKGVEAIVKTDYAWGSFIIEGVAILPSLVKKLTAELSYVRSVFLIDEDESRIRDLVFARGLWDDAYKYPDSVKEKEVEWAGAFSKWLVKECEKYSLPVVYIKDRASYIEEVKRLAL